MTYSAAGSLTRAGLCKLGLMGCLACSSDPGPVEPLEPTGGVATTSSATSGSTASTTTSSVTVSETSTGATSTTTTAGTDGSGGGGQLTTSSNSGTTSGATGASNLTATSASSSSESTGIGGATANSGTETTGSTTTGSGTTGEAVPSGGCGQPFDTGTFQGSVSAFGLERTYHMSVPESYDPSVPQRLVFGYHGSNYTGEMMRRYLDLEKPPLLEGTLFVYPDGIALEGQPDHIAWELDADGRDIAFFDALLAQLESQYCIDESRVFVNGQSYGGLMTNAVGCIRGDVVRAIAVVAGSGPRGSTCSGQVAAWLTHGMDDESVSFSSGEASRDHWVEANHCSQTTLPGTPEQCQVYQECDPGFPVIWCPHVNDGGHQHPSFGREAVREFLASF